MTAPICHPVFATEIVHVDGVALLGCQGARAAMADPAAWARLTNGCGAGAARYDWVPDHMYGLRVTPVCNQHDFGWHSCAFSRAAFDYQNDLFSVNLQRWIKAKTGWYNPLRYLRLSRAKKYVETVRTFGWQTFVDLKTKQGLTLISCQEAAA